LLQPKRGFFNAQSHFEIVQIIWWIFGVHLINFCVWFCVEAWFEKDYFDKNMENTNKGWEIASLFKQISKNIFAPKSFNYSNWNKTLHWDPCLFKLENSIFPINLLLAISTMNFATLCLNYGVVTSVTIATMVGSSWACNFCSSFCHCSSFKCLCVSSFEI
jgi:hypothetical protein